jgi:hypothetical protein
MAHRTNTDISCEDTPVCYRIDQKECRFPTLPYAASFARSNLLQIG